jgi:hypothetical protein
MLIILKNGWKHVIVKGPKVPMRIMPSIFVLPVNEKRRQTTSNINNSNVLHHMKCISSHSFDFL